MLVEGRYDDVLEPGRHFLPLKADFSDLSAALSETRDPRRLQQLADTAYDEICLSGRYSFQRLVEQVDEALRELGAGERRRRPIIARVAPAFARVEGELIRRGALSAGSARNQGPGGGFAPESRAASILPGMCGIAGAVSLRPRARPAPRRHAGPMNARIAHRGPDGEGSCGSTTTVK